MLMRISLCIQDRYFAGNKGQSKFSSNSNPEARCYTNMLQYQHYLPEHAYNQNPDEYFWGKTPKAGDEFTVVFTEPVQIQAVRIETGHPSQKNDFLRKGVLEASQTLSSRPPTALEKANCDNYVLLGNFTSGKTELREPKLKWAVKCLRIRVVEAQEEWLIISSIDLDVKPKT